MGWGQQQLPGKRIRHSSNNQLANENMDQLEPEDSPMQFCKRSRDDNHSATTSKLCSTDVMDTIHCDNDSGMSSCLPDGNYDSSSMASKSFALYGTTNNLTRS